MLIDYGRKRAKKGAGPVTLGTDIGVIKLIITHAAAVHGLDISSEPVDLARIALKRLGLIGKGTDRDRRSTKEELKRLFRCFDDNERLLTAMRLDEICRVEWRDLDVERRMLLIRDRKDPRDKTGNDQRIPQFDAAGFDACLPRFGSDKTTLVHLMPSGGGNHRISPIHAWTPSLVPDARRHYNLPGGFVLIGTFGDRASAKVCRHQYRAEAAGR